MKQLLYLTSLILVGLFTTSLAAQQAQPLQTQDQQRIREKADSLLQQYVALKDVVGITAGVYFQGEMVWAGGAGYRDQEEKLPATKEMRHRIASITKPMTAIAIMQLVEQGKIDLDATIQSYITDYPRHPEGDITVRHLLQHVSGIPFYASKKEGFPTMHFNTLDEAISLFKNRPLQHKPGSAYLYTTYGYTVLGSIIEKVTGQTYSDYMQQNIWDVAGMEHTHLEIFGETYPHQSKLYKKNKKGNFVADKQTDLSLKYPGGGLLSTVPDLLRFGRAVIDHKLISANSLELMRQPADVEWKGTPYGMGWYLVNDSVYGRIVRHGGKQSGTNTYLSIYLDQEFAVAVMANDYNSAGPVFNLHQQLVNMTLDAEKRYAPLRQIVHLTKADLKPFVGKYDFGKGQIMHISEKNNLLHTQLGKYPLTPIYAEAKQKFFYRNFDGQMEFVMNDQQKVVKVVFYQQGRPVEGARIR